MFMPPKGVFLDRLAAGRLLPWSPSRDLGGPLATLSDRVMREGCLRFCSVEAAQDEEAPVHGWRMREMALASHGGQTNGYRNMIDGRMSSSVADITCPRHTPLPPYQAIDYLLLYCTVR